MSSSRKPEHPRVSSTDDEEFSLMRDNIGQNFTTKQVGFNILKIYREFIKRLDIVSSHIISLFLQRTIAQL